MTGNNRKRLMSVSLILGLLPILVMGSELDDQYQEAMTAYENGQFTLAIQTFESIIDGNWESAELYYNLGNSYYRNGSIAGAVWAYEQCLLLDPGYADASYNLQLANLKVVDRLDIPEPPIYLKAYRELRGAFTSTQWILIIGFLLLMLAVLMAVRKIFDMPWTRWLENGLVVGLVICLLVGANAVWDNGHLSEGVIYGYSVSACSGPNENSTQLFEIHEGLKVKVLTLSESWIEIELMDGKSGWIPWNDIRLLN